MSKFMKKVYRFRAVDGNKLIGNDYTVIIEYATDRSLDNIDRDHITGILNVHKSYIKTWSNSVICADNGVINVDHLRKLNPKIKTVSKDDTIEKAIAQKIYQDLLRINDNIYVDSVVVQQKESI